MTRDSIGRTAAAAIALIALAGCDRLGSPMQVLAARPQAPDEFQVIARKPLQMPRTVALPTPQPGAPSPLDPTPNRDAVVALLGADVRPVGGGGAGAGEQALLSAANAAAAEPAIRSTLRAETALRGANQPYEPPLIWELFGMGGERTPPDALDPAAEARRLQTEGVSAAPIDPNDRPIVEGEAVVVQDPNLYPDLNAQRAPRNTLPSSRTVPAF